MPFRNSAIGGNKLIVPALQSPDFAFSPSPSYDVTGWKIQNNPSEVYAETFYGESVRVPTRFTTTGKYFDVAQYLGLQSYYSRADKKTLPSTVNLTKANQQLFLSLDFNTLTPQQTAQSDLFSVYFDITFVADVQPLLTPSGTVACRLRVTEYIGNTISVGPTVVANPQALALFSAAGNRTMIAQKWRVGIVGNADYFPLNTTNRIIFDIVAVCTVNAGARINATNTSLTIQQGININYNG